MPECVLLSFRRGDPRGLHPAGSRVTTLSAASPLDRGGQQTSYDNAKPRQCTSAGRWWTAGKIGLSLPRPIARHNPGLAEAILRRCVRMKFSRSTRPS